MSCKNSTHNQSCKALRLIAFLRTRYYHIIIEILKWSTIAEIPLSDVRIWDFFGLLPKTWASACINLSCCVFAVLSHMNICLLSYVLYEQYLNLNELREAAVIPRRKLTFTQWEDRRYTRLTKCWITETGRNICPSYSL